MRDSRSGAFSHHSLLLLFTIFWGANFILAEVALNEMLPISFSVSRFVIGGIAMLLLLYLQCYLDAKRAGEPLKFFPSVEKQDWGRLLLISVFGAALAPWLGIEGLGMTHGSRASIWLALGTVISTGCSVLFRTEKIGTYIYVGIILAAMVIAWLSIGENPSFYEILAGLLIIAGAIFVQLLDAFRTERDDSSTGPSQ